MVERSLVNLILEWGLFRLVIIFTKCPNQEDIVTMAPPKIRFVGGVIKCFSFEIAHEDIFKSRSHLNSHCCPIFLNEVFVIKNKIVHSQNHRN